MFCVSIENIKPTSCSSAPSSGGTYMPMNTCLSVGCGATCSRCTLSPENKIARLAHLCNSFCLPCVPDSPYLTRTYLLDRAALLPRTWLAQMPAASTIDLWNCLAKRRGVCSLAARPTSESSIASRMLRPEGALVGLSASEVLKGSCGTGGSSAASAISVFR